MKLGHKVSMHWGQALKSSGWWRTRSGEARVQQNQAGQPSPAFCTCDKGLELLEFFPEKDMGIFSAGIFQTPFLDGWVCSVWNRAWVWGLRAQCHQLLPWFTDTFGPQEV